MFSKKGKAFPIIITVIIIVIIIYLFVNVKQPLVVCDKTVKDELGITISENLETTLDGSKIKSMTLTKTIILPENYLEDDSYLESIMFALEKSYAYLEDAEVSITKTKDRVVSKIYIDDDETIILNNIQFFYNDELQIKINSNTKSSEVVTLRINDNYTEGELMTRLKNNGYSCM